MEGGRRWARWGVVGAGGRGGRRGAAAGLGEEAWRLEGLLQLLERRLLLAQLLALLARRGEESLRPVGWVCREAHGVGWAVAAMGPTGSLGGREQVSLSGYDERAVARLCMTSPMPCSASGSSKSRKPRFAAHTAASSTPTTRAAPARVTPTSATVPHGVAPTCSLPSKSLARSAHLVGASGRGRAGAAAGTPLRHSPAVGALGLGLGLGLGLAHRCAAFQLEASWGWKVTMVAASDRMSSGLLPSQSFSGSL